MLRAAPVMLAAVALVCLVPFGVQAEPPLTVRDLVQNPNRYDGKVVTVVGIIAGYREGASDSGHAYTVFRLIDGDVFIMVFIWNKHQFGNGAKVRVRGAFAKARSVGTVTVDNEIQAHRIEAVP